VDDPDLTGEGVTNGEQQLSKPQAHRTHRNRFSMRVADKSCPWARKSVGSSWLCLQSQCLSRAYASNLPTSLRLPCSIG